MTMNKNFIGIFLSLATVGVIATGCDKNQWPDDNMGMPGVPPGGNPGMGTGSDDGDKPVFDPEIAPWSGQTANDAGSDKVDQTNADIYHEANSFTEKVRINFSDNNANVSVTDDKILIYQEGAYVTVDMLTNSVKDAEIVVSGKSSDGQLKIYGEKKFKLTLDGVDLTCSKGPAINDQCKKRVFIHLADGTSNSLTDTQKYSDEPYYLNPENASDEDRKGCFFSEGNMIFSGSGVLQVKGKYKHGIVTDGYMWVRPGVTLVVDEAAKNAIHVKGDEADGIGFHMDGGLIYANVASVAGKAIKCDLNVDVKGGQLLLNTSGDATYDEGDNDTSSAACIKTDGNVTIEGGTHILKSTGTGGKGINCDGSMIFSGSETTVTTSGGSYYKSSSLTSSPKGIKVDGDFTMTDGTLNISVTGKADNYGSPEGLESKSVMTIDGGNLYSYATDDAMNAATGININGGNIYTYSATNDAIDSNGYLYINGGVVIANGASGAEESFDCDNSSRFLINGGTLIGIGGTSMQKPSSSSKQRVVIYGGLSLAKGDNLAILNSTGKPINVYNIPRSMQNMVLFFSSPDITSDAKYTISKGGKLTDYPSSWNGLYSGGSWSDGSQIGTFTSESVITVIGNSGMGGGGWRP